MIEAGAEVEHLRPGQRVAVDPALVCGTCDQCRLGRPNTCRNLQFMGSPGEALGAVARRLARVWVVSGRPVAFLDRFVPPSVHASGLYGLETSSGGVHAEHLSLPTPCPELDVLLAG